MKRKLRIDELSVTSFSTDEDRLARERGTVRGLGDVSYGTCRGERTCDDTCEGLRTCDGARTCADSCGCTERTCPELTCSFTCYQSCPDVEC